MGATLPPEEVEAYLAANKPYCDLLAKVVDEMYTKSEAERLAEQGLDVPPQQRPEDASKPSSASPRSDAPIHAAGATEGTNAEAPAEAKAAVEEVCETMRTLRIQAEKGKDKAQKERWARIDELLGNRKKTK